MSITPKYQVGQRVKCFREETDHVYGFDFIGEITAINVVDDDEIEYSITNAPILYGFMPCSIWEQEIIKSLDN